MNAQSQIAGWTTALLIRCSPQIEADREKRRMMRGIARSWNAIVLLRNMMREAGFVEDVNWTIGELIRAILAWIAEHPDEFEQIIQIIIAAIKTLIEIISALKPAHPSEEMGLNGAEAILEYCLSADRVSGPRYDPR